MKFSRFEMEMPPTLNEIIAEARRSPYASAKQKKVWTRRAELEAMQQGVLTFKGPVWVQFDYQLTSRRKDPDNVQASKKFILDALVNLGAIEDDSFKIVRGFKESFTLGGIDWVIVTIWDCEF